jgi:predicted AlkP superfamily phosphohydrolase/phosphomutase
VTNQTVLIGLDGATFTILDGLMEDDVMPFLKEFVKSGARADLRSVIPPLTPPAWTSLMTGASPGNHGVLDFFSPASPGSRHVRLTNSRDVHRETIWSIASRHDLKVTCLNFPLTFPPLAMNGYLVPGGWMPWRQLRLGCYPADLYDRLKALPGFDARELAMDPALEQKAIEGCNRDEYEDWIELHIRREQHWFDILRYLMNDEPCELTAILFDGVDKLQHLCWRFLDPTCMSDSPSSWERHIRQLCLSYFRQLDQLLAEIVAMADHDANIVMASDHGFGPTTEIFYVNTWLQQNGYLTWTDGTAPPDEGSEVLGIGQFARHVYELDWGRTTAYAATPSSNGVYIVVADEQNGTGVPAAKYQRFREQLIASLCDFTDGVDSEPVVSRIWTREEAFAGPHQDLAPDLTLALRDGGHVSVLASDTPLKQRKEAKGAHRPEGVFMAAGPGIRAGVTLPALSILDIAPLVLCSLGLPIPADFEGRLPTAAIQPSLLRKGTLSSGGPTEPTKDGRADTDEEHVLSPEDEKIMADRLRALGYIE